MSDNEKLLAGALWDLNRKPIDEWRVRPGIYRCPVCQSFNVAREKNETTRFGENGKESVDVERLIRCMECGTENTE